MDGCNLNWIGYLLNMLHDLDQYRQQLLFPTLFVEVLHADWSDLSLADKYTNRLDHSTLYMFVFRGLDQRNKHGDHVLHVNGFDSNFFGVAVLAQQCSRIHKLGHELDAGWDQIAFHKVFYDGDEQGR